MVKPALEGSSIGLSRADDFEQLRVAWQTAAAYDSHVMAERWITGSEYTAAVLGDQALPLIRLETSHDFYDYEAKYESEDTRYLVPCGLEADEERGRGNVLGHWLKLLVGIVTVVFSAELIVRMAMPSSQPPKLSAAA